MKKISHILFPYICDREDAYNFAEAMDDDYLREKVVYKILLERDFPNEREGVVNTDKIDVYYKALNKIFSGYNIDVSGYEDQIFNNLDIDWTKLSYYVKLNEEFCDNYANNKALAYVEVYQNLPIKYIGKSHYADWDYWYELFELIYKKDELIAEYKGGVVKDLKARFEFIYDSIDKEKDLLDWTMISICAKLTHDFILRFENKIKFSKVRHLPDDMIDRYADLLTWNERDGILNCASPETLNKHSHRFQWDYDLFCSKVSRRYMVEHISDFKLKYVFSKKIYYHMVRPYFLELRLRLNLPIYGEIANMSLNEKFIDKYKDRLDWNEITRYLYNNFDTDLREAFITKYADNIKWAHLWYWRLSVEFIERHIDRLNWRDISENCELSAEFVKKYEDKIDWGRISSDVMARLPEEVLEKHIDKINIETLSSCRWLSYEFMCKYADILDWDKVSSHNINLDINMITLLGDKVNILQIILFRRLSYSLIDALFDKFNALIFLQGELIVPVSIIEKHKDALDQRAFSIYCANDVRVMEKFVDKIDWDTYIKYIYVNEEEDGDDVIYIWELLMDKFCIDMDMVIKKKILPVKFLEKNIERLDWELIIKYQDLPEESIETLRRKLANIQY